MYLFIQDILGRNRQEFSINSKEDLEPIYKMFPNTRYIESDNFKDLVEMIAESVSGHYLDAWVKDDNLAEKFKEYIVENRDGIVEGYDPNMIVPIVGAGKEEDQELFADRLKGWYEKRNERELPYRRPTKEQVKPESELKPLTERDKLREAVDKANKNNKKE
jgi:hypothetical protein